MVNKTKSHDTARVRYKITNLEWQYLFSKSLLESNSVERYKVCRYGYALKNMLACATPQIDTELIVGKPSGRPITKAEEFEWNCIRQWVLQDDIWYSEIGICAPLDLDYILEHGLLRYSAKLSDEINIMDITEVKNVRRANFYKACGYVIEGILSFTDSYKKKAMELIEVNKNTRRKAELRTVVKNLSNVPANGAASFYQALQLIHLLTIPLSTRAYVIPYVKDIVPQLERFYLADEKKNKKQFAKADTFMISFLKMQLRHNPLGYDLIKVAFEKERAVRSSPFLDFVQGCYDRVKTASKKPYYILDECGEDSLPTFSSYQGFVSMSNINFLNILSRVLGIDEGGSVSLIVSFDNLKSRCIHEIRNVLQVIMIDDNTKLYEGQNDYFELLLSCFNNSSITAGNDISQGNDETRDVLLTFSGLGVLIGVLVDINEKVYITHSMTYVDYCNKLKENKQRLLKSSRWLRHSARNSEYQELMNEFEGIIKSYCSTFKTAFDGNFICDRANRIGSYSIVNDMDENS